MEISSLGFPAPTWSNPIPPPPPGGLSRDVFTPSTGDLAPLRRLLPARKNPQLFAALEKLEKDGWKFATFDRHAQNPIAADALRAHAFLSDDSTIRDRFYGDGMGSRSKLLVTCPNGTQVYQVYSVEQGASLDFFVGSGDPTGLKSPDLARRLADLERRGITPKACEETGVAGAWGAYLSMERGTDCYVDLERFRLAHVIGSTVEHVDAALEPHRALLDVYENVLRPEAGEGRLRAHLLGDVAQTIGWAVPGMTEREKADAFLQIARAVREGKDRGKDVADQTSGAVRAYEGLMDDPDAFRERLPVVAELARNLGTEHIKEACRYLWQEIPQATPFPEARAEKEAIFRRVAQSGLPLAHVIQATDQIAMRPWNEPIEDRVDTFEALAVATAGQAGYDGVLRDFECVLRYRAPGQSVRDAAQPYLALQRTLALSGDAREAAPTYAFLQESLRHGRLAVQSVDDLVQRFIESYVYVHDPAKARERLIATVPVLDSTIERGPQEVRIGGIRVPVRRA